MRSSSDVPPPQAPHADTAFALAAPSARGRAYNEPAFRYFLTVERKRSGRSGSPLVLVLVSLRRHPGSNVVIDPDIAERLFGSLHACLRATDVVGWFREPRIIGAVLTLSTASRGTSVVATVREKLHRSLAPALPAEVARQLRLRVHQRPPSMEQGR